MHISDIYTVGAKYGSRQSMDFVCSPWIVRINERKVQIDGQSMDFAAQTTDCLVHSQVQSNDKLQVSGVALTSYLGLYKSRARIAQSHSVISTLVPYCLLSSVQQRSTDRTLRTRLCPWRHLHILWPSVQEGS